MSITNAKTTKKTARVEEGEPPLPVVDGAARKSNGGSARNRSRRAGPVAETGAIASEASSGDVYVEQREHVWRRSPPRARSIQRFSLPGEHRLGAASRRTRRRGEVYVADAADGEGRRVRARTARQADRERPVGAEPDAHLGELSAQIDPTGADTHYYFQYGTVNCVSSPASCTDVPAPPGSDIGRRLYRSERERGTAGPESRARPTTTGSSPPTNTAQAEGAETFGTITTLPSAEGVLPDGRAWEMVSPAEKDGSGIEPLRDEGGLIQASEDGNAITYVANGPIVPEPEGNRAPYPTQALATRSSLGLVLAADRHAPDQGGGLHSRRSAGVPVLLARSVARPRAAG